MPINYKNYPPDWQETRKRILERAWNCCENCGIENGRIIPSWKNPETNKIVWSVCIPFDFDRSKVKKVKVVLTVAHLDHDEHNQDVKDDRLMAMCQLCHLRYDAEEKTKRRKLKSTIK